MSWPGPRPFPQLVENSSFWVLNNAKRKWSIVLYAPRNILGKGFRWKGAECEPKVQHWKFWPRFMFLCFLSLFNVSGKVQPPPGLAQKMYCCRCICLLASIVLTLQFDTIVDLYVSLRDWIWFRDLGDFFPLCNSNYVHLYVWVSYECLINDAVWNLISNPKILIPPKLFRMHVFCEWSPSIIYSVQQN